MQLLATWFSWQATHVSISTPPPNPQHVEKAGLGKEGNWIHLWNLEGKNYTQGTLYARYTRRGIQVSIPDSLHQTCADSGIRWMARFGMNFPSPPPFFYPFFFLFFFFILLLFHFYFIFYPGVVGVVSWNHRGFCVLMNLIGPNQGIIYYFVTSHNLRKY